MTEETAAPEPKRHFTKKLVLIGTSVGLLLATSTGVAVVMMVGVVHKAWCTRVGFFCGKATVTAVKTVVNGCPGGRLTGALDAEQTSEVPWTVAADVKGHVALQRAETNATGKSSIACYSQRFLASFTDMSNGVTYQCMGTIADTHYDGVCAKSAGAEALIAGTFVD